jgi:hypothetical protein
VISWSSQKQKVVAQSSTEAEFIAANALARDLIWFSMLLNDIFGVHLTPTMNIDNQAAQYWIDNEKEHHSKQKHIDTKYKLIKQWVKDVLLQVKKVHTDLNIADILTKSVDQKTFDRLVPMIYDGTTSVSENTNK